MEPGPGLAHGACGWLLSAQSQLSHTAQQSWRKAAAGCAALGSHTTECSPVGRFQSRPLHEAGGLEGSLQPSAEQGGAGISLMGQLPPAAPGAGPAPHRSPAKGPAGWCWRLGKAVPTPARAPRGWTHAGSRRARGAHPSARGRDGSCSVGDWCPWLTTFGGGRGPGGWRALRHCASPWCPCWRARR